MPRQITSITAQKKNPNRVSVYIDGEFAFGVYQDVILEFELRVGRVLGESDEERIKAADAFHVAKATAMNYIAYRPRTEQEIRSRLARSGLEDDVVERVLRRLYELHLLDDQAYAQRFVDTRFHSRGYGPERLRSDLIRRGVDRKLIDEALGEVLEPDETLAAAREQAEKRWARLSAEPDLRKRRKKLADFLRRRGFTYDTVRRVVDGTTRGAEE